LEAAQNRGQGEGEKLRWGEGSDFCQKGAWKSGGKGYFWKDFFMIE